VEYSNGRQGSQAGARRTTAVELIPIVDAADVVAVADFLHANLNDRIPWALSCSTDLGPVKPPNRGFMLRDGQRVVGTLLAMYSERLIAGEVERFCNMGSWCVLPEYRSRSMSLLNAVLAQEGYHFTSLSPDTGPQEIMAWLGFQFLDTTAALIPNLPWPSRPRKTKVSSDADVIETTLTGRDLAVYHDHAPAIAARHVVLIHGGEHCYVMYREFRYADIPVFAMILHVSNTPLFRRALVPFTRHLLLRHRLVGTLAEVRTVGYQPRLSLTLNNWPKVYRSPDLHAEDIDYLYSELACLPWSRGGLTGRNLLAQRRKAGEQ
jgi:hypothetical protein